MRPLRIGSRVRHVCGCQLLQGDSTEPDAALLQEPTSGECLLRNLSKDVSEICHDQASILIVRTAKEAVSFGSSTSFIRDRFIQIQDHSRECRPGCQLGGGDSFG